MKAVSIFPYFDAFYSSFFLHCLRSVYGAGNLRFTTEGFPDFKHTGILKLIVHDEQPRRIVIDVWDFAAIDEPALRWCDVYAKMNIDPANAVYRENAHKIVPSGPAFAVRSCHARDIAASSLHMLRLDLVSGDRRRISFPKTREHLTNWYRQWAHRRPPEEYRPGPGSLSDYVFFTSTYWKNDMSVNDLRAMFIRSCRSVPGIRFEGGFQRRRGIEVPAELTADRPYPHAEYIHKTQRSALTFNNHAVAGCHSWRLGEALSMGKAIVSLPMERRLPAPLVHARHIHYVEPAIESMKEAIERISRDTDYRTQLERGAREYFQQHMNPAAVIARITGSAPRETLTAPVIPARSAY